MCLPAGERTQKKRTASLQKSNTQHLHNQHYITETKSTNKMTGTRGMIMQDRVPQNNVIIPNLGCPTNCFAANCAAAAGHRFLRKNLYKQFFYQKDVCLQKRISTQEMRYRVYHPLAEACWSLQNRDPTVLVNDSMILLFQHNVVWRKRTCSQASYSGMTFFSVAPRK